MDIGVDTLAPLAFIIVFAYTVFGLTGFGSAIMAMPLLVHGEVTDHEIDLFDREAVFIERVMRPLRRDFPELKIVFEHITTRDAAQYVAEAEGPIAATITAHHLLYNRNEIFKGGINPHYYCLPVLKREAWTNPATVPMGEHQLVPLDAGEQIDWKMV
jgi:dihydroorotase